MTTFRLLGALALLGAMLLAGCGAKPAGPAVIGSIGVGGCPDADDVMRAGYGWFGGEQYGAPTDGWYVELGWRAVDAEDWTEEAILLAGTLEPGQLDAFKLASAQLPNPRTARVYSDELPDGCEGNITGVYGVRNDDMYPFVLAVATVEGCTLEGEGRYRSGWAVPDAGASTCALAVPSSRGAWTEARADEVGRAQVPAAPAPWSDAVGAPTEPCADCTTLWSLDVIEDVTPELSEFTVDWMPGDFEPCGYAEGAHHLYARDDGGALQAIPGTDGMALSGVLHDGGKAALVLVRNSSWFQVLPVAGGVVQAMDPDAPMRGHPHHEEDSEYLGLTEYCGP